MSRRNILLYGVSMLKPWNGYIPKDKKEMKYIYSIRNNPSGVASIFNSMTIEDRVEAIVEVLSDIKISYEDSEDKLKYKLSGDMVNENVEKFISNYQDCISCIKDNSGISDRKELIKKVVGELIEKTLEDNE